MAITQASRRRHLLVAVALAAVLSGVVIAVLTVGPGPRRGPRMRHRASAGAGASSPGARPRPSGAGVITSASRASSAPLTRAARYLGKSVGALEGQLRSGRSLAQIADSERGHSAGGLLEALERPRLLRIESLRARGDISARQAGRRIARVRRRAREILGRAYGR